VSVHAIHKIANAGSIQIEPLTVSDWELIEINSEFLEDGGLLSQVSVVYPNQILRLMLSPDFVNVRVLPSGFRSFLDECQKDNTRSNATTELQKKYKNGVRYLNSESINKSSDKGERFSSSEFEHYNGKKACKHPQSPVDSQFPSPSSVHNIKDKMQHHECLRIVANTEVIVTPKPRDTISGITDKQEPAHSLPIRIQPSLDDFSPSMKNMLGISADSSLIPCPPFYKAYMHPETILDYVPSWVDTVATGVHHKKGENMDDAPTSRIVRLWKCPPYIASLHPPFVEKNRSSSLSERNPIVLDKKSRNSLVKLPFAVARLYSTRNVEKGHIVLNNCICYQIFCRPLLDFVCLQVVTEFSLSQGSRNCLKELKKASIKLHVRPITILSNQPDNIESSLDHDIWHSPNHFKVESSIAQEVRNTPYSKNFEFFLSLLNLAPSFSEPRDTFPLIFGPMNIISFPSKESTTNINYYRLSIQPSNKYSLSQEDFEDESERNKATEVCNDFFLKIDDLKMLLQESLVTMTQKYDYRWISYCNRGEHLNIWQTEYFLNKLPASWLSLEKHSGTNATIKYIEQLLLERSFAHSMNMRNSKQKLNTVMIFGDNGCGKTFQALAMSAKHRISCSYATNYLDCAQLQSSSHLQLRDMMHELTKVFHQALRCQPSVLVFDDLDKLIPNTTPSNDGDKSINPNLNNQVKVVADHFLHMINAVVKAEATIFMIITSRSVNSLHKSIRSISSLLGIINVPPLELFESSSVFHTKLRQITGVPLSTETITLARGVEGYTPRDLEFLAERVFILQQNYIICQVKGKKVELKNLQCFVDEAISNYIPEHQQDLNLNNRKVLLNWNDIGGLFHVKNALTDIILRPMKYRRIYDNTPITLPQGILLYGPPGSGKSCIVPALAKEYKINLVTCHGPELLDKYIGSSEAKVRKLFETAQALSPAILFLDEFDALAPRRGTDNTGVTDRVVNQILTFLDGVESSQKKKSVVYTIAATSRPDKIDKALLRPGRLEKHIYVGFPENDEELKDIFSKIARCQNVDDNTQALIDNGDLIESLKNENVPIKSYSAADVKGGFETAHLAAVHEYLSRSKYSCDVNEANDLPAISNDQLVKSFLSTRPSLSNKSHNFFQKIHLPFLKNKKNDDFHGQSSSDCSSQGSKKSLETELKTTMR